MRRFRYQNTASKRLTLGGGTTFINILFNLNSLFQFDQSATGPESIPGLNEMARLYLKGKVYGIKVDVMYTPGCTSTGINIGAENIDNCHLALCAATENMTWPTSWASWEAYIANNPTEITQAWIPFGGSGKSRWNRLSKYFHLSRFASNKFNYRQDDDYVQDFDPSTGAMTANPSRIIEGSLILLSNTSAGAAKDVHVDVQIRCTYYVKFEKRKWQAQ